MNTYSTNYVKQHVRNSGKKEELLENKTGNAIQFPILSEKTGKERNH